MSELYGDQYDSVAGPGRGPVLAERLRRGAGALVFIGLIGAMGTWAYRLGTRDAAEVPIIRAMEGPTRVQPADPGGLQAAHQGLEVNEVLAGRPAPEAASPRILPPPVSLAAEDGAQGELVLTPPVSFGEEEAQNLRMPIGDPAEAEAPTDAASLPPANGGPAVVGAADLALAPEATLEDAIEAAIAQEAAPAGLRPRSRPEGLALARAATPDRVAAAAPAAAVREVASPGAGARLVQLGAYDSEALTRQAWGRLIDRHGDLLGAKSLYIERTTSNARVFYRLRVAGFDSTAQTGALCEALRARGVDCIPVTLQ